AQHVFHLYELLFNNVCHVELELFNSEEQRIIENISLTKDDIKPVGFDSDEHLIPYSQRAFPGFRWI
ncbi:MAG: type VI secretion system baseplate subunit TssF, partial [Deltaproteobacteria bacterium]|nr:type VI secretion system baseplate subunit TssF [Deltaproteobacteria bacterium]